MSDISAGESSTQRTDLTGDALMQAIRKQVEFYFSPSNLSMDKFLVSQMDPQMFVPLQVVANFKKKALPSWAVTVLLPPISNTDGHIQRQFNSYPIQVKMDAFIHFLAELQILQECPTVFCTFSSYIGRFLYLTGGEDVRSLDSQFEL